MNRLLLWLATAVAAVALAGGAAAILVVSGGDDDDDAGGGTSPTAEEGPDLGDREGNELRLLGADPATLDPHIATDADSARYIVEVFSGLVTIDENLQVAPDIAESWDVSADGTVYTFHLRRNVVFHSGKPVTAQTVKDSIERAASPETQSPVADVYLGDIVGVRDKLRGRADEISGIRVIDDYTLEITIDAPKPYFIAKLTYPTAFVVDVEQIESNPRNWTRRPNGTGPFVLSEWELGESIVLDANDRFYGG
ncbi:MAG TPA: ABC transporter substrate-binding protein, partial [Dehalococcoidia bacterium]|nr:ABC transporter substrate-binding protein [Dehalococcoidia bacterium]